VGGGGGGGVGKKRIWRGGAFLKLRISQRAAIDDLAGILSEGTQPGGLRGSVKPGFGGVAISG